MHVLLLMPVKVKRIDELQMLLPHHADDDIADVKKPRMMLMLMLNMILLMLIIKLLI